jgi:hypothetical protein
LDRYGTPGAPALKNTGYTAPPQKSESLARRNATFSCFYIRLPCFPLLTMPPRTILGIINRNRRIGNKLSANQRRKIQGARLVRVTLEAAGKVINYGARIA